MKKYTFSFNGRQTGAIGITYQITESYEANDIHESLSLLWTDYEMIRHLKVKQNGKSIKQPDVIKWANVRSLSQRTTPRK